MASRPIASLYRSRVMRDVRALVVVGLAAAMWPVVARADIVLPLAVTVNVTAFVLGGVVIIPVEALFLLAVTRPRSIGRALAHSALMNVASALLVGVILPVSISLIVGAAARALPSGATPVLAAAATLRAPWVPARLACLSMAFTAMWLALSLALAVWVERKIVGRFRFGLAGGLSAEEASAILWGNVLTFLLVVPLAVVLNLESFTW